jgi:FdhE protein
MLENLLRPFAALFIEKARLAVALKAELNPAQLPISPKRLSEGVPILTGISFDSLKPALDRAFAALVPVLKKSFPALAFDLDCIEAAQRNASLELSRLAETYWENRLEGLRETPLLPEADQGSVAFVVNLVISAVLQSLAPSVADWVSDLQWDRGYCPVCGSLPSISYLSKPQCSSSEFLVGGGGQRYLHCTICGQDWRVRRHLCAACERDDTDEHMYFHVPDTVGERVDICRLCGHYLPCIDLRDLDALPHLDTMSVGLVHLDMLAQEKGFSPMVRTPWNTFE